MEKYHIKCTTQASPVLNLLVNRFWLHIALNGLTYQGCIRIWNSFLQQTAVPQQGLVSQLPAILLIGIWYLDVTSVLAQSKESVHMHW